MARQRKTSSDRKAELVLLVVLVVAVVALGVLLRQRSEPAAAEEAPRAAVEPEIWPDTIRVEILNGALPGSTSIENLARDVQQYLASMEEVEFLFPFGVSNTCFRYDETVVVSRLQDRGRAFAVAALLKLDSASVVWELPLDSVPPEVDVVVYLGTDIADRREELIPDSSSDR